MRVLNDYRCISCGAENAYFVDTRVSSLVCQKCGGSATKVQRPIMGHLDPISGKWPMATDKWARDREKKAEAERKTSYYDPD
jgi:DNA-directed RNA polymerase subunit RPC12/RpoP